MLKQWLLGTKILPLALLVYLAGRVGFYIVESFRWPMDGDLTFLYYIAWLMNDQHYVPYRDVHETSFFGTFIFYSTLTKIIGYSALAFHWFDLFFWSVLSTVTFFLLLPLGIFCALIAILLFGEFYYSMGIGVHLQRDFIALLPAAVALLILRQNRFSPPLQSLLGGFLFGVASCIKPQFAAGIIVTTLYIAVPLLRRDKHWQHALRASLCSGIGFILAWLLGISWLLYHGILDRFIDMAVNYLPAYSSINGRNYARASTEAWSAAFQWTSGNVIPWLFPIALGFMVLRRRHDLKDINSWFLLPFFFWLLYLVYVPMAGKYWGYHILPSYYFLSILLALALASSTFEKKPALHLLVFSLWFVFIYLAVLKSSWLPSINVNYRQTDQIEKNTAELTEFLRGKLQPGDTIQPHVTHTRGPIFPAMLEIRAIPATPYLENYLLYHDVNSEFVQNARTVFMRRLQEHPPRFVIKTPSMYFFDGDNTEVVFKEFEHWLDENYQIVLSSTVSGKQSPMEKYIVYERRPR